MPLRPRVRALLVSLLALPVLALGLTAPTTATAAPVAAGTSFFTDPLGANDWSCRPTAARPHPVVLVHGTFGDRKALLDRLSLAAVAQGFCVFSLDYGNRGTGPIEESAQQLATFVDKVLAATGAPKVSLVGHSQGGMMPRYYIKFLGGDALVDDLVGLAPSNHGTYSPELLNPTSSFCASCAQQAAGSEFLQRLNAGDETPGDVSYTQVVTRYDAVVVPHTSGFLAAGERTTNIRIQDLCAFDATGHVFIPQDGPTVRVAMNALTRPGPADPAFRPSCWP